MKITRLTKKTAQPPPHVAEFINNLVQSSTDDLPAVLCQIDIWKWPRSDLNVWTKVLNKFDSVLEEIIRDYDVEKLQVNDFTPSTKKVLCAILRFERLLLENSTNRKMYNSYDRLNHLLACSDLDIVILSLNVLLRPAQQYSAQASVGHALNISTPRLQSLAKRWPHLREYGIGLADLAGQNGGPQVNALRPEAREVNFSFYKADSNAEMRKDKEKEPEKEKKMETDPPNVSQGSPRKGPVAPTALGSTAINIHVDEQKISSKSVMAVLADTIEAYSVPDDDKFELMCRIRAARALNKGNEADRVKLVIIRLLAIAIFGHTHTEAQATTSLFLYEPDLVANIAELLQIDNGVSVRVQTAAIAALDSLARYRSKNQEVLTAINAGVNHGIIMSLFRKTIADVADPESTLPQSFTDALLSFVTFIASQSSGGNMVVGAGLIPLLIQVIENKLPNRLPFLSKTMQLVDNILYGFANAFNMFCTARGVEALVNRIEHEVDLAISENDKGVSAHDSSLGDLPIARSAALKHILRSMHRMMQSSGTAEGLRGLIDLSLLKTIKKIIEHRSLFGPTVLPLAINIMATFVHNEPTSLTIIQENKLPEVFYNAVEAGLEPAIEVIQAVANAVGALCLNEVGQIQLAHRPSIIPGILGVFTSERHLKVLLDKENAVLVGTAIDELIRHHPLLKAAVFDALQSTIVKIEALGQTYEVHRESRQWYFLVPTTPSTNPMDSDVAMEDFEVAPSISSGLTGGEEDVELHDNDDDGRKSKPQDNTIVSFIDVLGRFLEGLFQHTPHCRDFVNMADGLTLLGRLTRLPCLPYDFANSVASDSMIQVMRTMTEVVPEQTLSHLSKLVKQSLDDTQSFWENVEESSKLLPLVDTTVEEEEAANHRFRDLVTLHIRVTLLSDVFSTAGHGHGRNAIGLLQTLMTNLSPEVVRNIGALHRATIWENIILNVGLLARGIEVKVTPPSSPFHRSPNQSSTNLLDGENTENIDTDPAQLVAQAMTSTTSPSALSKSSEPRHQNAVALKHMTRGLPSALAPFFQAIVKMFNVRRNLDPSQKRQISESSRILAEVMAKHLNIPSFNDIPSKYAYNTVMLGLYAILLVDERTSTHNLHNVLLFHLYCANGLQAILNVCQELTNTIERLMRIKEEDISEAGKKELDYAYGGLKVALHLLRPLISSKSIHESGQNSALLSRDKKDTDPDYFEPHNFVVKMRTALLPFLQGLWEAPWLLSAPLSVTKSIVKLVLEVVNDEGEEPKGSGSANEPHPPVNTLMRPPGPDENRIQLLIDMGFPRSAAERALVRTGNNLNAATELLLSHPFPLPPDPDPETEPEEPSAVEAESTADLEAASSTPPAADGDAEVTSPPAAAPDDDHAPISTGKTAEQWKKELDEAREPLQAGLSRRALLLIDEHVSLLFELHVVFVRSSNTHRQQAVQELVDDVKSFSPYAYDIQEQPLANRCRLIAIILSETATLLNAEMRTALMDSLLALLLSCVDHPDHPPRWLATHLLVTEALFTLAAEPRAITLPKEGEPIISQAISVGPPLVEAQNIVFDFCLRLLDTPSLPGDEFLAALRLFVFLTRHREMASRFLKHGGITILLKRVKESAVFGSSAYIVTILRHLAEDEQTVRQIMQHTVKRYFSQPRSHTVDVSTYVRSCSALALRDPEIFLECTSSLCELGQPFTSPTISLKSKTPSNEEEKDPQPEQADGPADMQVDSPSMMTTPTQPSPLNATVEGIIHTLLGELMVTMSETPSQSLDQDTTATSSPHHGPKEPAIRRQSPSDREGSLPQESKIDLNDYVSFIMQCLTELLFSYDSCKLAFLSYSPKKRNQTPAKDTTKYRTATLHFLLNDLITFGTINPQPDDRARNQITLCNWAMSVIVALCVDSTPNPEVKEVSADLVSVRKFVLEAVSRTIKDPPTSESIEARYGRLLGLADLCHRLLTVKFHGVSRKQTDDNLTHIAKIMLEKNFVPTLTTALSEIDLNYPNIRGLVPSILRPLEYLTKVAIKMSRSSAKSKESGEGVKSESETSFTSDEEEEGIEDEDREETPDLYRNSALGMYTGEMDDAHFSAEDDMDQDEEDEDGDVEMDFADETGSDDTSNTDEEPQEGLEDEARNIGEVWEDGEEEDDDLVEHDEEDDEDEANEDNVHVLGGDYDGEDVVWQDVPGGDGVRLGGGHIDEDEEPHIVPIQIVHEEDNGDDNMGSDEDYVTDHGSVAVEEVFRFGDAFVNPREGGGGLFITRRRDTADDNIQVFGRNRTNNPAPPTTHPLLLDNSAPQQRPTVNQSRAPRHAQRGVISGGNAELLQTIDDLIGGGAVQLFQHIMSRGRITGGPETIRLDVPVATGAVVNFGRGFIQRRAAPFSASVRVDSQQNTPDDKIGRELVPLLTPQRWAQEAKILNGEFVTERLGKLSNHVILALLPAAVEAIEQKRLQEEELARRQEAETASAEDKATDPSEVPPAEPSEDTAGDTLGSPVNETSDHAMEGVPPVGSETAEDEVAAVTMDVENQGSVAGPSDEETQPESSTPTTTQRVTVLIHGSAVDITETGIDPTFLEALPDDMREEVLNQHVREQRASRLERPADSQISSEFLDALPPEIRAEIIQQEAIQRAQARTGGVPADMDNASFIASLDPLLRQTVLMEQDEVFMQTLPSHMLAEVDAYRENHRQERTTRSSARVPPSGPTTGRKPALSHDAMLLLDKNGVAVLVRLLFFPHVLKKSLLLKVLVNLCENAKTRTELFNLLLSILQDGTGDLAAVDKSFSQMSFKTKPPPSRTAGKQKANVEYSTGLPIPSQVETVPDLVAQRCLEALTYIVGANELSSLFFLTEHEMPAGPRRSASKKGKGKEKQMPHYPVVLLLGLLDRQSLLRTPAIMESVVSLLATVTRPLASLKDPVKAKGPDESTTAPAATVSSPQSPPVAMELVESTEGTIASAAEPSTTTTTATSEPPTEASPQAPVPVKESIEAVEEKILLANPPQIPHAVLRLIVNILTVGECTGKTFQQSLALIQHLSYIPDARDVIAQELKSKAQEAGQNLSSDLDELAIALENSEGDLLVSSVATKFSPASSVQAKLLRVLKTIDYMYTPKPSASVEGTGSDDVKKVQSIYESFQFSGLWRRLGSCLSVIEEKPSTEHIATVLLPLIEALMVVCKYVGSPGSNVPRVLRSSVSPRTPTNGESMEDLFVTFTDAHRKILNLMVRNNPSLMSGSFSLLVHNPRVLDFDNKRNYFNQQLHRRTHTRDHYGTLQLNVRRARVFEDSFQHLQRKTGDQIKYGKLSIRFYDEEGVDAGGVTREWFQILARQMFDPNNALFQPCAADKLTYQPNKNSWVNPEHLSFFKFVGRVIGKAIYDGRLLDAYFARSLYRQLLGKPVDYKDVEWVDPEYYNSLCWILENDPTVLDLTFSVEADEFGVNKIVPLKEGGETIYVTQENKREFVQLSAQYRLLSSIEKQIENLLSGFYEIIPKDLVTIFNEQELELLISGTPDIDVDEWRAATEYNGYTSSDPNIVWWWRALKSFNRDERAKVLSFATGTSRVPLSGFVDLQGVQGVQRFSIHKAYGASDRLPQAHTCFNQIDLPQYTSYEMLRRQLLLAINEGGEGFAFS